MVRLQFFNKKLLIISVIIVFIISIISFFSVFFFVCDKKTEIYTYTGQIECSEFPQLSGKKIYIDPGHGGQSKTDTFRISRHGESEGEINLRVALILYDMLKKANAKPILSRYTDVDISLDERARHVAEVWPDLLVSIHHNGSVRPSDGVNYGSVFMHATKTTNPQSYDFAELLKAEFKKADLYCNIVSDYAIFKESGLKILRLTRHICPGVIGEFGFFSDKDFSLKLSDINFNTMEAEAYFRAIAEYFRRGMPTAELGVRKGKYYIKICSGNDKKGIKPGSLFITHNDIKLNYTKISENIYRIEMGDEVFPGEHRFIIRFKNTSGQSSPIYNHLFRKSVSQGDYDMLVMNGMRLIQSKSNVKRGTKMLLAALSMGTSDPNAKNLMLHIAEGFRLMGDMCAHEYYYRSARDFYPTSNTNSTRFGFLTKFYGTKIKIGCVEDFFN